jgi:hypothetical protein
MNALFGWTLIEGSYVLPSMIEALASRHGKPYLCVAGLRSGSKEWSRWAVQSLRICEKELPGQYKIKVMDVSRIGVENNLIALSAVRKNRAKELTGPGN